MADETETTQDKATAVDRVVHTPGPWRVVRRFDIYRDTQIPGVGGTYVGTTRGNSELPESVNRQCEADARLIASSPDLLEACQAVIAAVKYSGRRLIGAEYKSHQRLLAAVQKATEVV